MLHEVFQDPNKPDDPIEGGWTIQIHSPLPEDVPIGRYELDRMEPIIDEVVPRKEYIDRIQRACARHGQACLVRFYDHVDYEFDASVLDDLSEVQALQLDPY